MPLRIIVRLLSFDLKNHTPKPSSKRPKTGRIVILGDSLTAGFGVEETESYPHLLQKKIKSKSLNYKVINKGISGNKTIDGLKRLHSDVLEHEPEIVVLELGGNDFIGGLPIPKVQKNLTDIITQLQDRNIDVLLVGVLGIPKHGTRYILESRSMYRDLAKQFQLFFQPHIMRKTLLNKELMLDDRIHPSPNGHKVIANDMWKYLKPLL